MRSTWIHFEKNSKNYIPRNILRFFKKNYDQYHLTCMRKKHLHLVDWKRPPQGRHEVDLVRPSQSGPQLHSQTRENE